MSFKPTLNINTHLADVNEILGREAYRKLAKELGGVRAYGRDTSISVVKVAEVLGDWQAIQIFKYVDFESVDAARLLAADLAEVSLGVYERYRCGDGSMKQAIDTAKKFANGEAGKVMLNAAHKMAIAAQKQCIYAHDIKGPEYHAISAAVAACDPFGRAGDMVSGAFSESDLSLVFSNSHIDVVSALVKVLDVNKELFDRFAPLCPDDERHWLHLFSRRIYDVAIEELDIGDSHTQQNRQAFKVVLRKHLEVES